MTISILREIMADPFDETQGPITIFGSPPHEHYEIQDPQSQHNETPLLDNGFQGEPPTTPCVALIPAYPWPWCLPCHAFSWHPLWILSQHLPACGIHVPHAAQHTPAPEPDRDLDDQAAPPVPLPPGDAMMTIHYCAPETH